MGIINRDFVISLGELQDQYIDIFSEDADDGYEIILSALNSLKNEVFPIAFLEVIRLSAAFGVQIDLESLQKIAPPNSKEGLLDSISDRLLNIPNINARMIPAVIVTIIGEMLALLQNYQGYMSEDEILELVTSHLDRRD